MSLTNRDLTRTLDGLVPDFSLRETPPFLKVIVTLCYKQVNLIPVGTVSNLHHASAMQAYLCPFYR